MKLFSLMTFVGLALSSHALAGEQSSTSGTAAKISTELFMKLSQPDTVRTAFGVSYGGHLRGFAYLDLQDVPASPGRKEQSFQASSYAVGLTFRDKVTGRNSTGVESQVLSSSSDIFLRYSEKSALLDRGDYWSLGIQPGILMSGADGLSLNLGVEYTVNFIDGKSADEQNALRSAGVPSRSLSPVLTFNYSL